MSRCRVVERTLKVRVVDLEPGLAIDYDLLNDLCYPAHPEEGVMFWPPELAIQLKEGGYIEGTLTAYWVATKKLMDIENEVWIETGGNNRWPPVAGRG
jgi:hypothetical protein